MQRLIGMSLEVSGPMSNREETGHRDAIALKIAESLRDNDSYHFPPGVVYSMDQINELIVRGEELLEQQTKSAGVQEKKEAEKTVGKFALFSTLDWMGEDFPSFKVLLFDTEQDAYKYAANLLCEYADCVARCGNGIYEYDGQHWTAAQLVVNWSETNLEAEDYFHVYETSYFPALTIEDIKNL
jgi:hypothetical protein